MRIIAIVLGATSIAISICFIVAGFEASSEKDEVVRGWLKWMVFMLWILFGWFVTGFLAVIATIHSFTKIEGEYATLLEPYSAKHVVARAFSVTALILPIVVFIFLATL